MHRTAAELRGRMADPNAECDCSRACPHSVPRADCNFLALDRLSASQAMEMRCCKCGGRVR